MRARCLSPACRRFREPRIILVHLGRLDMQAAIGQLPVPGDDPLVVGDLAQIDIGVRQDGDHARTDRHRDQGLHLALRKLHRPALQIGIKRLGAPHAGGAWIDMGDDPGAIQFGDEDHLAPAGQPMLPGQRPHQIAAMEFAAHFGPAVVNQAARSGLAVRAPPFRRLGEFGNIQKLAAQRARSARAARDNLTRTRHRAILLGER